MSIRPDPNAPHPQQTHLTVLEVDDIVAGLGKLDPGKPYGTPLALATDRIKPTTAFEFVWLRQGPTGKTQVYLSKRPANGQGYDGEWCAQGTGLRMSDGLVEETEDFDKAQAEAEEKIVDRLEKEFGAPVTSFGMADYYLNPLEVRNGQRGFYIGLIFLVEVEGDGRADETHGWFDLDQLPQPLVKIHEQWIIPLAVVAFERLQ